MAKRLECVIPDCHATIEADSEEAVMAQVEGHASEKHPDLELTEETVADIRANIQDV